jgi:hypothetical protein
MSGGKYRSFGITLRTRVGINSGLKSGFDTWIKKQDYGAYVYEKEDSDEHIHAQIWIDEARTRGNVKKPCDAMIRKYFEPDDYKLSIASCVRIAYNDEFIEEYCEKENELIYSNIPADKDRLKYYPSEEEQDLAQAKVHSKNLWLRELEVLWSQHATDEEKETINDYNVACFMGRMCLQDLWAIKKDFKIRQQECLILRIWLSKKNAENLFLTKEQIKSKADLEKMLEELMR